MHHRSFRIACVALTLVAAARADIVSLVPVADTTLIEAYPDNNMGAHYFFNAGSNLHGARNRGLLRFDVAGGIPAGSTIKSAQLLLKVVGIPTDEPQGGNFRLHRMLRSWEEGQKESVLGPGRGDTATINEATWNHRMAFTTNVWGEPGGLAGTDFAVAFSAEMFIEPINQLPYTFGSSVQMTEDVQTWLNVPESNFGWLLKVEDEQSKTTARRFASREDPEYPPELQVEFQPPPMLEVSRHGGELRLSFIAQPDQSYSLEQTASLTGTWSSITNISAGAVERTINVTNAISGATGFYRVLVEE